MATPLTTTGMLTDLEITRFRAFDHLKIERLGHVNLIVGKNNVGKSTLLEALRLYTTPDPLPALRDIIYSRDELQNKPDDSAEARDQISASALLSLFNGRLPLESLQKPITIGPSKGDKLEIHLTWFHQTPNNTLAEDAHGRGALVPALEFRRGSASRRIPLDYQFPPLGRAAFHQESTDLGPPCVMVPANGFGSIETARMWDQIVLSEWEDEVLSALRILAAKVSRLSFVGGGRLGERSARVKVDGEKVPVPLRSLGDGANRLMGLLLALVEAKSGLLLIDEIENGIHYAALTDIWRSLIRLALRLNVQIVATTHSWDCVTAFQCATLENTAADGVLTRLEQTESGFRAVQFDEEELNIAAASRIEVR